MYMCQSYMYLVDSFEVKVLRPGNVVVLVLGLSLLGQDDGILKQKHSPPVFGYLYDGQVPLAKNLSLFFDALLGSRERQWCVCVCVCVCS